MKRKETQNNRVLTMPRSLPRTGPRAQGSQDRPIKKFICRSGERSGATTSRDPSVREKLGKWKPVDGQQRRSYEKPRSRPSGLTPRGSGPGGCRRLHPGKVNYHGRSFQGAGGPPGQKLSSTKGIIEIQDRSGGTSRN